ncbi:hypothetical protein N8Z26_01615 [Burkholderiales bacterium]|nr:hypothetical protein [Burkholderiales bacterium]
MLVRYAPLWAHLCVYVWTCLIAAAALYFGQGSFMILVSHFSGVNIPTNYSSQQATVLWALLLIAPALFAFGFVAAVRIRIGGALFRKIGGISDWDAPVWVPVLMCLAAASVGAYDLLRVGAFAKLSAWTDYEAWVAGRWALFSTLGYFNFVNLYLILPVSAAWVILSIKGGGWKALAARLIPLAVVMVLTLFLFQKKGLIVSLIIIFGAVLLHRVLSGAWTRRMTWLLAAGISLLVAAYFIMLLIPVLSAELRSVRADDLSTIQQAEKHIEKSCESAGNTEEMIAKCKEASLFLGPLRFRHVLAYAILAPMTRTSLPAMHYPLVFPEERAYYGFDFGQDILGFGGMPDDNLVIWKRMYPNMPGGSAGAPYQFALYSQVGVVWALVLCIAVGAALGVMWQVMLADDISRVWRSLMGSVVLLFSIYAAIDSIRGSLLSSYGLIWPWLFISLVFFIGHLFNRRQEAMLP